MNNNSLIDLEKERLELIKKYGLDEKSINEFKSKIKKVSEEEATKLGSELFETVSRRWFNDNYEKVIELIYNGADIEYKDEQKGDFALIKCARKNHKKTFAALLKAGANVNQVNNYLTTATMASARHGCRDILEMLILMGADINARCLDGDNAIMSAKRHSQVECFNMLVSASAHLNNRNILNETLIDLSSTANFDLSKLSSSILPSNNNGVTFDDTQNLLDEATQKLAKLK